MGGNGVAISRPLDGVHMQARKIGVRTTVGVSEAVHRSTHNGLEALTGASDFALSFFSIAIVQDGVLCGVCSDTKALAMQVTQLCLAHHRHVSRMHPGFGFQLLQNLLAAVKGEVLQLLL